MVLMPEAACLGQRARGKPSSARTEWNGGSGPAVITTCDEPDDGQRKVAPATQQLGARSRELRTAHRPLPTVNWRSCHWRRL